MKKGILGGTFDPVHLGHLALAGAARDELGLDEVIFIPAGRPVFKTERPVTAAEHRLAMLRLAIVDEPDFSLSTVELERPGPSYSVDTVAALAGEDELYFVIGADGLAGLPRWHEPQRLLELCKLAVAPRPGFAAGDLEALEAELPGIGGRVVRLRGPQLDISASDIRRRAARGESLHSLVPAPVADYIEEYRLYREE
jgi:nicotinate-nucleotide adenylyltransferase